MALYHMLVNIIDVNVEYNNSVILQNINLTINKDQIITIIGPNGAGKSTLIKAILGLVRISSGIIKLKPNIKVGYMPQKLFITPLLPLQVNRFLSISIRHNAKKIKQRISMVSQLLSIKHLLDTSVQELSGGELQRILLARALLNQPDLLVLDEPAHSVDIAGQAELYALIKEIKAQYNCGVLMVSHDLHIVMAGTDSVICLNKHICCHGHPAMVSKDPEFLNLFGTGMSANLALYTHYHDHQHDLEGKIVDN